MKILVLVSIAMTWPSHADTPEGFPLPSGTYTFRLVDWEFSHGDDLHIYGKASVVIRDSHIRVVYRSGGGTHVSGAHADGEVIADGELATGEMPNQWVIFDSDTQSIVGYDNGGDDCPIVVDPQRRLVFTC
jgi:hypothetical protein